MQKMWDNVVLVLAQRQKRPPSIDMALQMHEYASAAGGRHIYYPPAGRDDWACVAGAPGSGRAVG